MLNYKSFFKNTGDNFIAVVGLGYVGLPLAILLDTKYNVIGFDVNFFRIEQLSNNIDSTNEISEKKLSKCNIQFTSNEKDLNKAKLIIVCVPTPIDRHNIPDLTHIKNASEIVGRNISKDSVIVFESTVYPGLTEEECVPIIETVSG